MARGAGTKPSKLALAIAQPASPSVTTTAPLPKRSRIARAITSASPAACGANSTAAIFEGLIRSAARSTASSSAASPRPGTASEGGTSRSTTVGIPAARAVSSAARVAERGSCETSVVKRAARFRNSAWSTRTCSAVTSEVAPGAM